MPAPLETGTLLVASPDLSEDPNFNRTVVVVTHYSEEDGTMGLVLNRPLGEQVELYSADELLRLVDTIPNTTGTDTSEIEKELSEEIKSSALGRMFYQGGPVHQNTLFFLHRLDAIIKGGIEIVDGLYLGGDLDTLRAEAEVAKADQPLLRFYLGCAGWNKGQLESEIGYGAWILAPSDPDLIFASTPETIWREALYALGGKYRSISVLPEDPAVN
ncbi:MAG TPA: YqgE/AlgH family protein [Candidatus Latescibacteria bacterium]|nr:YqgE/AlgH family protein [Candidatus Handelsmanbacteria bacterium]HIL07255.1 YqgE/AlgH family protein [Candidatus Latescibacterota bacterium]